MATEPTSPWPRKLEDVDNDLEERATTLGRLVTAVETLREEVAQSHALVDVAVVMQEARTYADTTRQEADVYAERVKATADAEAAAQRQATAEACAAQEAAARETVAQIYQEGQEKVAALETEYTTRRHALAAVHASLRGAWTEYADRLQTAAHTVTTLLADPPGELPTRDRIPVTAPAAAAATGPQIATDDPAITPALASASAPSAVSGMPVLPPDALEPVDAPLTLGAGYDPDAPLPGLGAPPPRPLVARDQVVPKLVERPLG